MSAHLRHTSILDFRTTADFQNTISMRGLLHVYLILLVAIGITSCTGPSTSPSTSADAAFVKLPKDQRIALMAEQEYSMTADPATGESSKEQLYKVRQTIKAERYRTADDITWAPRGPDNVGGRTRAILVDRRDPSGETIFAGSVSGGLWKCTAALSDPQWVRIDAYSGSPAISSIVQDPSDPEILYVSTGEGWFNADAYRGDGIYKSTDGGETWALLEETSGSTFRYTQKLLFNQIGQLLACTQARGIMMTDDGGETWTRILGNSRAADVEMATNGDLYAGMGIFSTNGLYKSTDNGASWDFVDIPDVDGYERVEIALSPADSSRVLVLMQGEEDRDCRYILESTDAGLTWKQLSVPSAAGMSNFARNQAWYDLIAAYHPTDTSVIYIGGVDLLRSIDGGDTWQQLSNWRQNQDLIYVHADQHNMTYIPGQDDAMYFGNDGGVWSSQDLLADEPDFDDRSLGYISTQFYACSVHPDPEVDYYIAGAQDNGTQALTNEGVGPSFSIRGGDGAFNHIDEEDGDIQIASTQRGNYAYTTDGWQSRSFLSPLRSSLFINPTTYDTPSKTMYASYSDAAYLYLEVETGFVDTVFISGLGTQSISALRVDPLDSDILYIGSEQGLVMKVSNPKSQDYQLEILEVNSGYIRNIDVDRGNSDRIVYCLSNFGVQNIFYSEDAGDTFVNLDYNLPNVPVRWLLFNPNNPRILLAATEVGIWQLDLSDTDRQEWDFVSEEIGPMRVDMLVPRVADGHIVAATYGRGLYTTDSYAIAAVGFARGASTIIEETTLQQDCIESRIVEVPIKLTRAVDTITTIDISLAGTAIEGVDFDIATRTYTILPGDLDLVVPVVLYDDRVVEQDKELIMTMVSNITTSVAQHVITLEDDDKSVVAGSTASELYYGNSSGQTDAVFNGFYEDNRVQVLYTEEMLAAAGITQEVSVESFTLICAAKSSTRPYTDYTIRLANYDDLELIEPTFTVASFTEVYNDTFTSALGLNEFVFEEAFVYDGEGGILIEMCYDNGSFSNSDQLLYTTGSDATFAVMESDGDIGCELDGDVSVLDGALDIIWSVRTQAVLMSEINRVLSTDISASEEAVFILNDSLLATVVAPDTLLDDCVSVSLVLNDEGLVACDVADCTPHAARVYLIEANANQALEVSLYYDVSILEEVDTAQLSVLNIDRDSLIEASYAIAADVVVVTFVCRESGNYSIAAPLSTFTQDVKIDNRPSTYDYINYYNLQGQLIATDNGVEILHSGVYIRQYIVDGRPVYVDKVLMMGR